MLLSLCVDLNFRSNLPNLNMFSTHRRLQNPLFIELLRLLIWDDWNSHWLQIKFCKSRWKRQLPTHLRLKFTLVANKIFQKPGQSVNCLVGISSPSMHPIYFHKSALKQFWLFFATKTSLSKMDFLRETILWLFLAQMTSLGSRWIFTERHEAGRLCDGAAGQVPWALSHLPRAGQRQRQRPTSPTWSRSWKSFHLAKNWLQ